LYHVTMWRCKFLCSLIARPHHVISGRVSYKVKGSSEPIELSNSAPYHDNPSTSIVFSECLSLMHRPPLCLRQRPRVQAKRLQRRKELPRRPPRPRRPPPNRHRHILLGSKSSLYVTVLLCLLAYAHACCRTASLITLMMLVKVFHALLSRRYTESCYLHVR
jgi:hypothetical protein